MSRKRCIIIVLAIVAIAATFTFSGHLTEWVNTGERSLASLSIGKYHIAVVGLLIFLIGLVLPRSSARFNRISWGISAFGAFILLMAFFAADALIVWASLALAVAAFLSFEESRRLRRDNVDREAREKKERLLNKVIDWAVDVSSRKVTVGMLKPEWLIETRTDREEIMRFIQIFGNLELLSEYGVLAQRSKYISLIASHSSNALGKAVDKVCRKINSHCEVLLEGMCVVNQRNGTLFEPNTLA